MSSEKTRSFGLGRARHVDPSLLSSNHALLANSHELNVLEGERARGDYSFSLSRKCECESN